MRVIQTSEITNAVSELCIRANCVMNEGLLNALHEARDSEELPVAKATLGCMLENAAIAAGEMVPICQDTGAACVFVELGQDVHIEGGSLVDAINAGVALGYTEGYLRKSMVADPLRRVNTDDNTPALITVDIVDGDALKITLAPKGAGSENMGQLKMLKPADGIDGVRDFVLDAVRHAGPNPCPPIIVGVGVGGNFDHVASLAKRALLRPVGVHNPDPFYAQLEVELLDAINAFGTGPAGFGGATTALAVNIEQAPTHIACLPVAVNINCHVARHEEVVL
ncbi:MAG: fumarate hydratase [Coriobacteriia bacterium]|nr:MAG: fumarate hydratase [Coriobacteriia bacterium]